MSYVPPKLKYKPESLYKSDINDLVEQELNKGGPGSGIRGHKTIKDKHGGASHEGPTMPRAMRDALKETHDKMSNKERKKLNPDISIEAKKEKLSLDQKKRDMRHGIRHEEDERTEPQKMADARRGPNFKRDWK